MARSIPQGRPPRRLAVLAATLHAGGPAVADRLMRRLRHFRPEDCVPNRTDQGAALVRARTSGSQHLEPIPSRARAFRSSLVLTPPIRAKEGYESHREN